MGGQISRYADMYSSYLIKNVKIKYRPAVGTSTNGVFRLALFYEGWSASMEPAMVDFQALAMFKDAMTTQCWAPAELDVRNVPHKLPAYEISVMSEATAAGYRLAHQCLAYCVWSTTSTSDATVGYIDLEMDVELYNPSPPMAGVPSFFQDLNRATKVSVTQREKDALQLQVMKAHEYLDTALSKITVAPSLPIDSVWKVNIAALGGTAVSDNLPVEVKNATSSPVPVDVRNSTVHTSTYINNTTLQPVPVREQPLAEDSVSDNEVLVPRLNLAPAAAAAACASRPDPSVLKRTR